MSPQRLGGLWESLCLCMFHDTLSGSSIRLAVKDYDATFRKIQETGNELLRSTILALESPLKSEGAVVLNTMVGIPRRQVIRLPSGDLGIAETSGSHLSGSIEYLAPASGVTGRYSPARVSSS